MIEDAVPAPPRIGGTEIPKERGFWSRKRLVLAVAGLILGLFLADAAYVAIRLRSTLRDAASQLRSAADLLDAEDTGPAKRHLENARSSASSARSLTKHPAFLIGGLLPFVGGDVEAIEVLARTAELSARAGLEGERAVRAAAGSEGGSLAGSLYSDGVVNFAAFDRAEPHIRAAAATLAEVRSTLEMAPRARFDQISSAVDEAKRLVAQADAAAEKSLAALDGLPGLLGRDGEREYFLAFQSPSESRGSGGLPGVYAILRADQGHLSLGKVHPIGKLGIADEPVEAPGWYRGLYRDAGALMDPRQSGYSPEFPTVAKVWLAIYEQRTGRTLDGALAMDPVALGEMTRGTGVVSAPGLDREIGPDNAAETILYDSYVEFETPEAQNRYIGALVAALWSRLGSGDVDAQGLISGVSTAARGQHLKVYSEDLEVQAALVRLDVDGTYPDEGDSVQIIYSNNAGANKIDYFLEKEIDTTVELQRDGSAYVRTAITLVNAIPADVPQSLVFGPGIDGDEAGDNGMVLSALMPAGSRMESFTIDGKKSPALEGAEGSYPVAYDIIVIPAGETSRVEITYLMPDAWDVGRGFDLVFYPQATVNPASVTVTVVPAAGSSIVSTDGGGLVTDGVGRVSGLLDQTRRVVVKLAD